MQRVLGVLGVLEGWGARASGNWRSEGKRRNAKGQSLGDDSGTFGTAGKETSAAPRFAARLVRAALPLRPPPKLHALRSARGCVALR